MTAPAKAAPMREDVTQARPISEHPCHGLFASAGDRLTHRHWFQDNELMPTCERCGTPIDREHKETGAVCWEPEKRHEVITLADRHAISNAAIAALGEWLAWPDAGRDGPREVTVQQTLSFLRGLPNRLGYGAHTARPDAGEGYATAFYEIATMLGIGAQVASPADVWRDQMRPTLEALTARPDAVSMDAKADNMEARPDAGDEDVERVARALNNIEYEANRENGGLVHLKRCVAVQVKEARAALAAMREGVDRGMVEREALKRVVSDCQLAINALGNSDRMFDSVVSGFGIIRDRAAAALSPEQPR